MRQYRWLGYLFDSARGVFANRSGGDWLKPIESGEFANTFWTPISAAATIVIGGFFTPQKRGAAAATITIITTSITAAADIVIGSLAEPTQ